MSVNISFALVKLENENTYNSLGEKKEILHLYKCPKYELQEGNEVLVEGTGVLPERGKIVKLLNYVDADIYAFIMEMNKGRETRKILTKCLMKPLEYPEEELSND